MVEKDADNKPPDHEFSPSEFYDPEEPNKSFTLMKLLMAKNFRIHQARFGLFDKRVLDALAIVPRHEFVLPDTVHLAYNNVALTLDYEELTTDCQTTTTISSPQIVGWMTQALDLQELLSGEENQYDFLEVGAGSGYQMAVLHLLAQMLILTGNFQIVGTEINADLIAGTQERLLAYPNAKVKYVTLNNPLPFEDESFDGIIVSAAVFVEESEKLVRTMHRLRQTGYYSSAYANKLIEDFRRYGNTDERLGDFINLLRPGGRLVVPIGLPSRTEDTDYPGFQLLMVINKTDEGVEYKWTDQTCWFVEYQR